MFLFRKEDRLKSPTEPNYIVACLIYLFNSAEDNGVCVNYEIIKVEVILLCLNDFRIIFCLSWPSHSSRCKTVFLRLPFLTQASMLFSHHSGLSYCSWHVWVCMTTLDIPIEPSRIPASQSLLSSSRSQSVVHWRLGHSRNLSLYNKLEWKDVVLNICNVLQSLFIYDIGINQRRFCSVSYTAFPWALPRLRFIIIAARRIIALLVNFYIDLMTFLYFFMFLLCNYNSCIYSGELCLRSRQMK
jgi:hypothetical protein